MCRIPRTHYNQIDIFIIFQNISILSRNQNQMNFASLLFYIYLELCNRKFRRLDFDSENRARNTNKAEAVPKYVFHCPESHRNRPKPAPKPTHYGTAPKTCRSPLRNRPGTCRNPLRNLPEPIAEPLPQSAPNLTSAEDPIAYIVEENDI